MSLLERFFSYADENFDFNYRIGSPACFFFQDLLLLPCVRQLAPSSSKDCPLVFLTSESFASCRSRVKHKFSFPVNFLPLPFPALSWPM